MEAILAHGRVPYTYKAAALMTYHNVLSLYPVNLLRLPVRADMDFEEELRANDRLRSAFHALTGTTATDTNTVPIDATDRFVIECPLKNRCRIACAQKIGFIQYCREIEDRLYKQSVEDVINDELNYVSWLVRRFESAEMMDCKEQLQENLLLEEDEEQEIEEQEEFAEIPTTKTKNRMPDKKSIKLFR